MRQENNNTATVSTNFSWLGLLGVILVVAKIADGAGYENPVGDWSWWLVLLPFYLGLIILLLILLLWGLAAGGIGGIDAYKRRKRRKAIDKRAAVRLRKP
jgi:hypothetical protein